MREFVTDQIFPNGGYILVGYLALSFILFWKGKKNLKEKSRDIRDEVIVIDWDRSVIWMNRFAVPLILTIILGLYAFDIGWLMDVILFFGFLFILLVFVGSLTQEKIFIRMSGVTSVPLYGKAKTFYYSQIDKVEISKTLKEVENQKTEKLSLKIYKENDSLKISEKKSEIESVLAFIKDKISPDKFEVQNESNDSRED